MGMQIELLKEVVAIARSAGKAVLEVYESSFSVRAKDDASPVTDADERAHQLIVRALETVTPDIPVISEEGAKTDANARFWLVDPLDGTKEFIGRNGEFTVNIALVEDGRPALGVVLAPALGRLFAGAPGIAFVETGGARSTIVCRRPPAEGLTVLAAAGGQVTTLDGTELRYGKPGLANPAFVAFSAA